MSSIPSTFISQLKDASAKIGNEMIPSPFIILIPILSKASFNISEQIASTGTLKPFLSSSNL